MLLKIGMSMVYRIALALSLLLLSGCGGESATNSVDPSSSPESLAADDSKPKTWTLTCEYKVYGGEDDDIVDDDTKTQHEISEQIIRDSFQTLDWESNTTNCDILLEYKKNTAEYAWIKIDGTLSESPKDQDRMRGNLTLPAKDGEGWENYFFPDIPDRKVAVQSLVDFYLQNKDYTPPPNWQLQ